MGAASTARASEARAHPKFVVPVASSLGASTYTSGPDQEGEHERKKARMLPVRRGVSRAFLFLPGHLRSGICAVRLAIPSFLSVLPLPNVHLYTMTSNTRLRGLVDSGPRSFMSACLLAGTDRLDGGDLRWAGSVYYRIWSTVEMFPSISLLFVLALRADPSLVQAWACASAVPFATKESDPSLTKDARTFSSKFRFAPQQHNHRPRMHAKEWKRDALSFQ
ncbi:hypothetical protein B0H14DRAFT_3609881 [Mycena olivaceomarginata]|nr:hypothetical protein B0H14DRAFT_3609881 [Mycena olivaceomarginata]